MIVILVVGVTAALISSLSTTAIANKRNATSAESLAKAREALIGYAVTYGDTHPEDMTKPRDPHGYLPCPDPDGNAGANQEGSSETCGTAGANALGRLPWRTLQLPALYDGAQECLWYAVSGSHKNNPKAGLTMNWDTPAQLHVYGSDGNEIAPGEIVAIVIAPGGVLPGNAPRSGTAAPTCGGNYAAAAYLDHDTIHGIDNADATSGKFILPHEHRDTNGNVILAVNDQFVYITRQDLWTAIQGRVVREAKRCLDDYAAANGGRYPWAVPLSTPTSFAPLMLGAYSTRFGRLPTRPNVQTEVITNDIVTMQDRFADLWTALESFAADKSLAKLLAMKASALAAKNAADAVGDNYDGTPLGSPADALKDAADDAQDKLFTSSSSAYIASIQQQIVDAANTLAAAMSSEFTQAAGMSDSWPASCTLFTSTQWTQWKDLLFYQVAAGFQPAGAASCGAGCLSVVGSAHTAAGSGSYRAVVIGAGRRLGASRDSATLGDYLEADNLLPRNDPSLAYQTLRVTDDGYPAINDLVLCLDGRVNCP